MKTCSVTNCKTPPTTTIQFNTSTKTYQYCHTHTKIWWNKKKQDYDGPWKKTATILKKERTYY